MDPDNGTTNEAPQEPENQITIDQDKARAFQFELEAHQNMTMGIVGGLLAAIVGAVVWAVVTVATGYQIGWMAIGVGFLAGLAVRFLGKGISNSFGIVGGICALFGCLLGNLLTVCGFVAQEEEASTTQVFFSLLQEPMAAVELLKLTFSPMDLLFYAIAVYAGFKYSFRQITEAEIAALSKAE
jgi:hypothetical protein